MNFRRAVIAAVGACILAAGGAASIAVTPVSRMSTPWWHARFLAKQEELARSSPRMVWLGDSITQDWELAGPQPWRDFAPIWHAYYGDRDAINLGFKGDSTCHVLWRLAHGELDMHPKLIVLLIGANNFGHIHTDADATFAGIEAILATLHAHLPATKVIVIGVLPSIRSAWVDANTKRLNALLAAHLAGSDFADFINVGSIFMKDGRVDPARFLDPHLVPPDPPLHPDASAQAAIAAAIEPLVARDLGDRIHRPAD